MPRLFVFRASDGALVIYDGVTRATRVAKLLPGQTVSVEVIGRPCRRREAKSGRGRPVTMMNPVRQEALQVLAELSELVPEVRLGQMMANLSYLARGPSNESIWDMEDDELLAVARKHLEEWRSRRGAMA